MSQHQTETKGSNPPIDKTAIRDASTVIVMRNRFEDPHILMGQRGATAAFMPNKFVFPGGAVDLADADIPLATPMPALCADRIAQDSARDMSHPLAVAAIRELWEETGLVLGAPGAWDMTPPADWMDFARTGHLPSAEALQFVFRAITPPGRPRRFDARFFLIDADAVSTDLDDFSAACDELSHLQWIPLPKVREFDLPFITEVVLAEVADRARDSAPPASVPFFDSSGGDSRFHRLKERLSEQERSD
ncbi:DNA mismatch repair protein MutT [Litorivita pollutaquae]|uniref:DNA mismatch repair protein MutT n=1 Tax=Litorivita pollutaquae TaxID=2200892 RepID=A0A2V4MRN6_9RHOB|nr:NUDIX hydrolase [Litorivita pollutaquae]OUS22234.1 DNA mismatch repair protein MutT [Rhodobacterales bacterium 59_46_T64]PYC46808.1 DNA mismatch repair protein MutT [Litorivita pollutaquae]